MHLIWVMCPGIYYKMEPIYNTTPCSANDKMFKVFSSVLSVFCYLIVLIFESCNLSVMYLIKHVEDVCV